jgi:hypothetical protein
MRNFVLLLLLFIWVTSLAEGPFGPSSQPFEKNLYFFELVGGGIIPSMNYSKQEFQSLKKDQNIQLNGGAAFRMQFSKALSVATEFTYRQQGLTILSRNNYELRVNYLNLFVPLEAEINAFGKKKKENTKLLVFAGPFAAYNLWGKQTAGDVQMDLTSAELGQYDYGAEAGLGVRIPTYSTNSKSFLTFKISYFRGFGNTYPKSFANYSSAEMDNFLLSDGGTRTNQGIRGIISIEIPLNFKANSTFTGGGQGSRTYKRFVNIR